MSLKYHFQHIKNNTLKNVVFFTFHGTQNETIIFKNQTITIKEQRLCVVSALPGCVRIVLVSAAVVWFMHVMKSIR